MAELERQMEVEALTAIFLMGEEIEILDENVLVIACNPNSNEPGEHSSLKIRFELPEGYPITDSVKFFIIDAQRLDESDLREITDLVNDTIAQNLGMPMMYAIVEAINDWLLENEGYDRYMPEDVDQSGLEDEEADSQVDESDDDMGSLHANPSGNLELKSLVPVEQRVTGEEFLAWAAEFKLEMIAKGIWSDPSANLKHGQLTGKAIFTQENGSHDVFWGDESLYND